MIHHLHPRLINPLARPLIVITEVVVAIHTVSLNLNDLNLL